MSRKDKKEVKKLRRQVEALKAELKTQEKSGQKATPKTTTGRPPKREETVGYNIRPDLKRTALLTLVSLAILLTAFLTQGQWIEFIR